MGQSLAPPTQPSIAGCELVLLRRITIACKAVSTKTQVVKISTREILKVFTKHDAGGVFWVPRHGSALVGGGTTSL